MSNPQRKLNNKARIGAVAGAFASLMIVVSADANSTTQFDASFIQQIQSYCATSWRNARIASDDWDDCTQQVFLEMLEKMPEKEIARAISTPDSEQRRELNRAIWRIAKRVSRQANLLPLNGFDVADQKDSEQHEEKLNQLNTVSRVAAERLGKKQRQIVDRILDGESVGQIATSLKTSPSRVSDAKYRAIKKIREFV